MSTYRIARFRFLAFPLKVKHQFALAFEFSTVGSVRKRVTFELFSHNIVKCQFRILESKVIELADNFDLRVGQIQSALGRLFLGGHEQSVALAVL